MANRRIWIAAVLLAAACRAADGESVAADPPRDSILAAAPAAVADTPPPPVDTGAAVAPDTAAAGPPRLTADGWGALRIGMTRAEVVAAAGEDANPEAVGGPDPESCDEFRPRRAPPGMRVMIEGGRLTRISVARDAAVRTDAGLGVGDPAAAVRAAYGARATSTPHKYVDAPAEYITVWQTEASDSTARGIVYEVGEDGRVAQVHAGSSSIQYVEGCL